MTGTEPKLTEPIKLESGGGDTDTDTPPPPHVTPPPTPIKMYDVTISMAKLGKQCSKSGQKAAEICSCCSKRNSKRTTPILSKTRILEDSSTPPPQPPRESSTVKMRQHPPPPPPNNMRCCCCDGDRSDGVPEVQNNDSQRCSTLRLFVFCLALLQLVQVMGSGYGKSSLTSIERRYQLNSFQIGFLQSCFHIGNLTLILFVSYYGSGWHRPRAIAIGALMMSAASFLSAAPQFINKRYQPFHTNNIDHFSNSTTQEFESAGAVWSDPLCRDSSTKLAGFNQTMEISVENFNNGEELEPESWLFILIAVGSVIKGMGHTPLHPLGISFIDDYASPDNSAMYIGVVSAFPLFGPAVGFIIGSFTTNLWVDVGWVQDVSIIDLKPTDVRWVGAWWIGYLASGILLLIVSIPLFFFPRTVPTEVTSQGGGDEDGGCLICMQGLCTSSSAGDEDDDDDYLDEEERSNLRKSHICTGGSEHERILHSLIPANTDEKTLEKIYSNRSDVYLQNYRESNLELYDVKSLHNLEREKKRNFRVTTKSCSDYPSITAAVDSDNEIEQHLYSVKCLSTPVIARAPTVEQSPSVHKVPSASRKCQSQIVRRTSTCRSVMSRTSKRLSSTYDPPSSLKDFCNSLHSVLGDAVFVNTTLGFVCLTSFLGACFTYISKYMETQFHLSASSANLLNGSVNLPMAVVGNVIGGWVVRRGNLNVKRTLCIIMIGLVMTLAVSCTLFFFVGDDDGRGTKDFAPRPNDQFGQQCSNRCGCEVKFLASPVCDVTTQTTYRSACFAGCHDSRKTDGQYFFYNCSCLLRNGSSTTEVGNLSTNVDAIVTNFNDSREVVAGECTSQNVRSILPYFIAFMGAASMSSGLSATPSTLAILRIVKPSQKALAIGVVFVFTRILAWIPSPIYVGYAIDRSCLLWSQKEGPSSLMQGSHHCESYDKGGLRRAFFGCTVLQLLVALVFYFTALIVLIRRTRRRNNSKDSLINFRVSTS